MNSDSYDTYHLFLESIVNLDEISQSQYVFSVRRATTLGQKLELYMSVIFKIKNNHLRNSLLQIYYSSSSPYSSYSSSSSYGLLSLSSFPSLSSSLDSSSLDKSKK